MAGVSPLFGAITPHIGLRRGCPDDAGKSRPSRRPGIFKKCTGKLDVIQLAKARPPSRDKVKRLKIRLALECDANAALLLLVLVFTLLGVSKMLIRHGIVGARNA